MFTKLGNNIWIYTYSTLDVAHLWYVALDYIHILMKLDIWFVYIGDELMIFSFCKKIGWSLLNPPRFTRVSNPSIIPILTTLSTKNLDKWAKNLIGFINWVGKISQIIGLQAGLDLYPWLSKIDFTAGWIVMNITLA